MSVKALFRGMRADPSNPDQPLPGNSASHLGVRPSDIPITAGMVDPGTGGMSVVCDDPAALPAHRKPEVHGGTAGKDVCIFKILESQLPSDLIARQDQPTNLPAHRSVEPRRTCTFQFYEQALHSTKPNWVII